jgi:hypothetical protein
MPDLSKAEKVTTETQRTQRTQSRGRRGGVGSWGVLPNHDARPALDKTRLGDRVGTGSRDLIDLDLDLVPILTTPYKYISKYR